MFVERMLHDDMDEIAAQITALRFVLEVILANGLIAGSHGQAVAFVAEMKRRARVAEVPEGTEPSVAVAMRSTDLIDRLLDAAMQRAEEGRSRAGSAPTR